MCNLYDVDNCATPQLPILCPIIDSKPRVPCPTWICPAVSSLVVYLVYQGYFLSMGDLQKLGYSQHLFLFLSFKFQCRFVDKFANVRIQTGISNVPSNRSTNWATTTHCPLVASFLIFVYVGIQTGITSVRNNRFTNWATTRSRPLFSFSSFLIAM